jgi:hypothetical protein
LHTQSREYATDEVVAALIRLEHKEMATQLIMEVEVSVISVSRAPHLGTLESNLLAYSVIHLQNLTLNDKLCIYTANINRILNQSKRINTLRRIISPKTFAGSS